MILAESHKFLDEWFEQIRKLGLDVDGLKLDHLAYTACSEEEYEKIKSEMSEAWDEISEHLVSERKVGIFRLKSPIEYKEYKIWAMELLGPEALKDCNSGFEHAEFTLTSSFEEFIRKYPNLNWDAKNINRLDFPRLKLVLGNGCEVKFHLKGVLD